MGDRKYPRILEIAVRAGRWSFIAGSSVALISGAGCGDDTEQGDTGYSDRDAIEDQKEYWPELLGVVVDIPARDHGEDTQWLDIQDVVTGPDVGSGYELAGDDAGNGGYDDGPTMGLPWYDVEVPVDVRVDVLDIVDEELDFEQIDVDSDFVEQTEDIADAEIFTAEVDVADTDGSDTDVDDLDVDTDVSDTDAGTEGVD